MERMTSGAFARASGGVFQITHDHTVVQSLLDDGKITAAEAASHPQRGQAARDLVVLAMDEGGPDNITCIVADVLSSQVPACR